MDAETVRTLSPWIGALATGLAYVGLAFAVYLTFRLLDFPDLTVNGSMSLGAVVVPVDRQSPEAEALAIAEMTEGNVYDAVDRYSRQGKIAYIHLRNVVGKVPNYRETFIDEGDVDMLRILSILARNGFEGVVIPDHTPQMSCPANCYIEPGALFPAPALNLQQFVAQGGTAFDTTCGGGVIMDELETFSTYEDVDDDLDERPRRGRPPKPWRRPPEAPTWLDELGIAG